MPFTIFVIIAMSSLLGYGVGVNKGMQQQAKALHAPAPQVSPEPLPNAVDPAGNNQ